MLAPLPLLVFCDDTYHPAAIARTGLADLTAAGVIAPVWREDVTGWDSAELANYPVVLFSKSNAVSATNPTPWLHGGAESVFREYVRRGGGLVAVHSGTASYAAVPAVRGLLGGTFLHHPPACDLLVEPTAGHPLTAGIAAAFTVHDEPYVMALDDPQADVFLRTRSSHGLQPAGWTRSEGSGRVAVLTPGHFPEVWQHPSFQTLLRNALRWVRPTPDRVSA